MKPKPLPTLYCLLCRDRWSGSAPAQHHAYILSEWRKAHAGHLYTIGK